jgi:hypothetical protein
MAAALVRSRPGNSNEGSGRVELRWLVGGDGEGDMGAGRVLMGGLWLLLSLDTIRRAQFRSIRPAEDSDSSGAAHLRQALKADTAASSFDVTVLFVVALIVLFVVALIVLFGGNSLQGYPSHTSV